MTLEIRSLPVFSAVSYWLDHRSLYKNQQNFEIALSKTMSVMMVSYNGYYADRAFNDFKKAFERQKQNFENNPETFHNLGFENFTKMMEMIAGNMDPLDYSFRDAQFVWGLQKFAFQMRDVWMSLPHGHQVTINNNGIKFADDYNVLPVDIVNGISNSLRAGQIPDKVTEYKKIRSYRDDLKQLIPST